MLELCCYMTLCQMDLGHKFLAYKNAMNNNYKINNFITAANFVRLILELEPTGVRLIINTTPMLIDIRVEARDAALDEEVLPGVPG